ncbi:MAG TPA: flagellar assembly protein FliX [Stellaceae bacterium]|nr:flagellar assembly protein FliX [Stellaceae bacterium]
MRIEWTPPVRRTTARRDERTDAASDDKFAEALGGEPPPAPATAAPSLNPVDALLIAQELPDALAGRRRAVQRGSALLDRLEELRLGLLAGVLPRERLDEMAQLAKTARETVDDPRLAAVLDEIDLRVAVELAKLGTAV